jgi:P-type Cu2+ transporter
MKSTEKKNLPVTGMHCASCALRVEKQLQAHEGVRSAVVNFAASSVLVEYDPSVAGVEEFKETLNEIGFDIIAGENKNIEADEAAMKETAELRHNTIWAAILAFPVVIIGMFLMNLPYRNWIMLVLSTPVVFWFGRGFFISAAKQIRHGSVNMDTLVALSTGIAYLFSLINTLFPSLFGEGNNHNMVYYEASAVIIVFILLGRLLEGRAKAGTAVAIRKLMGLKPATVTLIDENGVEKTVQTASVVVGDLLRVKPGERIPVDGTVTDGNSFVDESSITGEPVAVEKTPGSQVFAGTINQKGSFIIKAGKVGDETLLARIISMVQEAQGSKPPVQKLVDRIASVFVPAVMGLALTTFAVWMIIGGPDSLEHAFLALVSVLIIACPCALGLATPTAVMVGIGKGAEQGILIKDASGLEQIHKTDAVVLDKTGTITEGELHVTGWHWREDNSNRNKEILLGIELLSEHPFAGAVVKSLQKENIAGVKVEQFESITGKGVSAMFNGKKYFAGNMSLLNDEGIVPDEDDKKNIAVLHGENDSALWFAGDGKILSIIVVTDRIKDDSAIAIKRLRGEGIEVHMLTGDNEQAASAIARQAGVDYYRASQLPDDKAQYVRELQKNGKRVAMIGDGINDSEAMAFADVSIAMGKGSDIAMDVADMTIVSSSLQAIPSAISLSRATLKTIKQNLFWAFFYNVIAIPLAAGLLFPLFGVMLNPMIAGAAMAMSSVSVVSNSLRLKYKKI